MEVRGLNGGTQLKFILELWWELNSTDSEFGPMAGFCEHGNEPSESTKGGRCLGQLRESLI
jgi:hypothetical protein